MIFIIMKQYTISELKAEFTKLNYKWLPFMVVGIRSKENQKNVFDDLIAIVNGNSITWYTCTTNPGTHWLKNVLSPKGAAILKEGQWIDSWQIGMHQGKYKALTQAKAITVYRDNDLDDLSEASKLTETGFFGINIHRANDKFMSKLIDKWSAGCQVLNDPKQYQDFLLKCMNANQKYFTYTLLNEF